jgi:predicted SAM-dependent methyltransferase
MIKIHMGCGWRDFGSDWVHIDGGDYDHLNYKSITELEFSNDTIDLIYASHVLEYFDRMEVIPLLAEWRRVLKPDGVLRIAVPDFAALCNLYQRCEIRLENVLGPLYGAMNMGDEKIYHKTTYDLHNLNSLLTENGFYDIMRYDWRKTEHSQFDDHSQAYFPHMDKQSGTLVSLNVECKKAP